MLANEAMTILIKMNYKWYSLPKVTNLKLVVTKITSNTEFIVTEL